MRLSDEMEPTCMDQILWFLCRSGPYKTTIQTKCHAQYTQIIAVARIRTSIYVIGYFMWQVMTRQHNRIEFKIQIPGHACCLIDGGFDILKKFYRRCDCDRIGQHEDVVNTSTTGTAVQYPSWQWRSWKEYLGQFFFKPVKGIRQYQHLSFDSNEPSIVSAKKTCDGTEKKIKILKDQKFQFREIRRLDVLPSGGLSESRLSYVYSHVRPFVRPAFREETCPSPVQ